MVLLPFFDIPSGFQLGKITEECPFQGPVFFELLLTTVNFLLNTANSLACRHGFFKILFSHYNNFSRLRELLFLYYDYDAPLCTGNNPKLQRDACTTPTFSPHFRKISIDYSKLKLSHNVSGFTNLTNSVRSYFIKSS